MAARLRDRIPALAALPLGFALLVLTLHRFDLSTFVVAGDRYVRHIDGGAAVTIRPNANGYDGEFFYRLAQAPLSFEGEAGGVRFDYPVRRMGRWVYPAMAWAVSLGQARFVPLGLLLVNIGALAAVAGLAWRFASLSLVPGWAAAAIILWPGFLVTLTHDTAELVTCALLLAALLAYTRERPVSYAVFAIIATLTRETVWPAFAGFFVVLVLRSRHPAREAKVWAAGLALVAMPIWRVTLTALWSGAPRYGDHETILGLPFAGLVGRLGALLGPFGHTVPWRIEIANRSLFVLTAFPLLGALTVAVFRLRRAWRDPVMAPIAGAWCGQAALMSMVTADGPWVEPVAYGRAFSELFVLSCLVSGAGGRAHPRRFLAVQAMAFAAMALACILQLGF